MRIFLILMSMLFLIFCLFGQPALAINPTDTMVMKIVIDVGSQEINDLASKTSNIRNLLDIILYDLIAPTSVQSPIAELGGQPHVGKIQEPRLLNFKTCEIRLSADRVSI